VPLLMINKKGKGKNTLVGTKILLVSTSFRATLFFRYRMNWPSGRFDAKISWTHKAHAIGRSIALLLIAYYWLSIYLNA